MYRIANPTEILAITGYRVEDIKLAKESWVLPWHTCQVLDLSPFSYNFDIHVMSSEKIPFVMPTVFTIGADSDSLQLTKYARLFSCHDKDSAYVRALLQGIIEGEVRVLAASRTMENIFDEIRVVRDKAMDQVQERLRELGMWLYAVNFKNFVELPGYKSFSYLGVKKRQEIETKAKLDKSSAKMREEIGCCSQDNQTQRNLIRISTETKILFLKKQMQYKDEEMKSKALMKLNQKFAEVELSTVVKVREINSNIELEDKQRRLEIAKSRTQEHKIKTEYDTMVHEESLKLYRRKKATDANIYEKTKNAEVDKKVAESQFFTETLAGDGLQYKMEKEADGLATLTNAQANQIETLISKLGGNVYNFLEYLRLTGSKTSEVASTSGDQG